MANKGLTKKEEFFKVLNLISTKKVKVKYCRTIKERLRPSVQQESLALPKKIPSPSTSSSAGTSSGIPADVKKEEELKLQGGFRWQFSSLKRLVFYYNSQPAEVHEKEAATEAIEERVFCWRHCALLKIPSQVRTILTFKSCSSI